MKTQGQRAGRPDGHQLGPRGPRAQRPGPAGSRRAQPPSGSGPRQPGSLLADQTPGEPSGEDGEAGLWGSLRGQEGCGGEQGAGCCCAEAGRCGDTRREFRGASVLLWRCRCDGLRAPGRSPRCLSGAERGGGGSRQCPQTTPQRHELPTAESVLPAQDATSSPVRLTPPRRQRPKATWGVGRDNLRSPQVSVPYCVVFNNRIVFLKYHIH